MAPEPESICPDAAIGGTMSGVLVLRAGRRFRVGEKVGLSPSATVQALEQQRTSSRTLDPLRTVGRKRKQARA